LECCEDGCLHGTAPIVYKRKLMPATRQVNVRYGSVADITGAHRVGLLVPRPDISVGQAASVLTRTTWPSTSKSQARPTSISATFGAIARIRYSIGGKGASTLVSPKR